MDDTIRIFIDRILKAGNADVRQCAWHEAGHRFFWKALFPDISTRYGIRDGLPCVLRNDGAHSLKIADMTIEDASRYIYIKLGGIAAEMTMLGQDSDAQIDQIADFVVSDYYNTEASRLDWKDDSEHGGDIPEAFRLIGGKVGWSKENIRANFAAVLKSCVKNIKANKAEFDAEVAEATALFRQWREMGLLEV